MNRTYRFHSRWKAMKLYPRKSLLRRDVQMKLIVSDIRTITGVNILLEYFNMIDRKCKDAMRLLEFCKIDTENLSPPEAKEPLLLTWGGEEQ